MTSAIDLKRGIIPTTAMLNLEFALGKNKVDLKKLNVRELDELIKEQIDHSLIRDLNGFRELGYDLCCRYVEGYAVELAMYPVLFCGLYENGFPFDLKSHVIRVPQRISFEILWRQNESNLETYTYEIAKTWGESRYIYQIQENFLFLKRPAERKSNSFILLDVFITYNKVPDENKLIITKVNVTPVSIFCFCERFGDKAPIVAHNLFSCLEIAYRETAEDKELKAKQFRKKFEQMKRLLEATSC
jgi:hypothetical protein